MSATMNRVLVTGRGVVSAIGQDVPAFASALLAGAQGIGPVNVGGTDGLAPRQIAGVRGFDPLAHFAANELALLDRSAQFALVATRQAVAESGLAFGAEAAGRTAVIFGTGAGCAQTLEEGYHSHYVHGRRPHPLSVPKLMINAIASHVSLSYGITGPAFVVATACASSAYAIALGFQMVRSGAVDAAIVGGTEACLTSGGLRAWDALRVMAPDTCRPFSKGRLGLVLGEGAAVLVIESAAQAQARGALSHGEILGAALGSDAHHITNPSAEGQALAMRQCLADAGLDATQISYVNAHGTGTTTNDATETRALRQVFGAHADALRVSSTKAMHGHTLGGAGAIEALATLIALQEQMAPPTINFVENDPECDLNCVPNQAQPLRQPYGLSNSFAFGGHNAVLAFGSAHAA